MTIEDFEALVVSYGSRKYECGQVSQSGSVPRWLKDATEERMQAVLAEFDLACKARGGGVVIAEGGWDARMGKVDVGQHWVGRSAALDGRFVRVEVVPVIPDPNDPSIPEAEKKNEAARRCRDLTP